MDRAKDFKKFCGLLAMLDESYGQKSSKLKAEVYFNALEDHGIGDVEKAVFISIKTIKFFPKPVELIELIDGDVNSRALIAWRMAVDHRDVYHTFQFDDPAIHYCLQEIFGGWQPFCEKTMDELKWEEKRFLDLYKLTIKRPDLLASAPTKMLGYFEEDNSAKGFDEHIPDTVPVITKPPGRKQIEEVKVKEINP